MRVMVIVTATGDGERGIFSTTVQAMSIRPLCEMADFDQNLTPTIAAT